MIRPPPRQIAIRKFAQAVRQRTQQISLLFGARFSLQLICPTLAFDDRALLFDLP